MSFARRGLIALRRAAPQQTLVAQAVNRTFPQQQRGTYLFSTFSAFGSDLLTGLVNLVTPYTSAASPHSEPSVGSSPKPAPMTKPTEHSSKETRDITRFYRRQSQEFRPNTPDGSVKIGAHSAVHPSGTTYREAIHSSTYDSKTETQTSPVKPMLPPINIYQYHRTGQMGVTQVYREVPKIFAEPNGNRARLSELEIKLGQQPPLKFTAAAIVLQALRISDKVIIVSRRESLEAEGRTRKEVYEYQKNIIDTGIYSGGQVHKDGNSTTQYFDFSRTLNFDLFAYRDFIGLIVREKNHSQTNAGGMESISRNVIKDGHLVEGGSPSDKYLAAFGRKFIRKEGITLEQENEKGSYEEKYFEKVYADNLADIKIDIDPLELLKVFKFVHDVQSLLTFKAAMEFAIENNLVFKLNSSDYQLFTDNIKRLGSMSWELPSAIITDPRFKDLDTSFTDISKVREAAKEMSRLNKLINQSTEEAHKPTEPGTTPSLKMS